MDPSLTANQLGRNAAEVTFTKRSTEDCLSDERMEEIARRLTVRFDSRDPVVRSNQPPTDKTLIWHNLADNKVYIFSRDADQWVESDISATQCLSAATKNFLKKDEAGCLFAQVSADEASILELDDEKNPKVTRYPRTERFDVTLTSTGSGLAEHEITIATFEDITAAIFVMPRAELPADARWWVHAQEETKITVKFKGLANSTSYNVSFIIQQVKV